MPIHMIAFVSLAAFLVFCFSRTATLVVPDTINWNFVKFGGTVLSATALYVVKGRNVYVPRVRVLKRDL